MKKVDSNTLIQFIGMVGIMASLVFVGLQMRQSQQIALANLSATTTSFFLSGIDSLAEPQLSYDTYLRQYLGLEPRTEEYSWVRDNHAHSYWYIASNQYLLNELGLVSDEVWVGFLDVARAAYNTCAQRNIYELRRFTLNPGFVSLIEQGPDQCN